VIKILLLLLLPLFAEARLGSSGVYTEAVVTKVPDAAARAALVPADGDLVVQLDSDVVYIWDGSTSTWVAMGGAGVVFGGGASTDNAIARFDGITGSIVQNSACSISDGGVLTAEGLAAPYIRPVVDSTTAFQVRRQDAATVAMNFDTTNGRLHIGGTSLALASTSQLQVKGTDGGAPATRTAMTFGNGGISAPSNIATEANGDKWVFWSTGSHKGAIGFATTEMWFQSTANVGGVNNKFRFYGGQASAPQEILAFGTGSALGFVWNDLGLDLPFRFEGVGDANLLYGDGTNARLGIGTATPFFKVDLVGDLRIREANKLYFGGTGAADNDVNLYRSAANTLKTDDAFEAASVKSDGGFQVSTTAAQPACDATSRGLVWVVRGGAGVADSFEVCMKDDLDAYLWVAK